MGFRFYTNMVSRASRSFAAGSFITGMFLVGFGLLIYLLPEFFATLAAMAFFAVGAGCCVMGMKLFIAQRHLEAMTRNSSGAYRENVRIHGEDGFDA